LETFGRPRVVTGAVLEDEASLLLRVNSLGFDFPAVPPGLLCELAQVAAVDCEIGQPPHARGVRLTGFGFRFLKFEDVPEGRPALRCPSRNPGHPPEAAVDLPWVDKPLLELLLRWTFRPADECVGTARPALFLQDPPEPPVGGLAALEDGAAGEPAVPGATERP